MVKQTQIMVIKYHDHDDGSRSKTQSKAKAGAKKTECLKKGQVAKKKTSPRGS